MKTEERVTRMRDIASSLDGVAAELGELVDDATAAHLPTAAGRCQRMRAAAHTTAAGLRIQASKLEAATLAATRPP